VLSLLLVFALGAVGCDDGDDGRDGDDGAPGAPGAQGPPGPPGAVSAGTVAITGSTGDSDVTTSAVSGVANVDVVVKAELSDGTVLATTAPDAAGNWTLLVPMGPTVDIVFYDGTTNPMTKLGTLSGIATADQGGQTIDLGVVTIAADGTATAANISGADWFISINYELGMHCTGFDFSYCCVLPPYNSVQAQVVKKGALPLLMEGHAEEKGGHLGLHQEIMVDPQNGKTYRLKYSHDDNTATEGSKGFYFNARFDVDGDGNATEKGEVVSNAYWTHLYVLEATLEGGNPNHTSEEANKATLGIDATAAGGFPLQVPLDSGPSGQPLSSKPGKPAFMAIAGAGGTKVWTKSPVLDNTPIVLTNPGIWEALGLPLTSFLDSEVAGKSFLALDETDIQPYQVARVTLVNAETHATILDSKGNPVTRTGTEPIDIPNCANCHAGAVGTDRSPTGDVYYTDDGTAGGNSLFAAGHPDAGNAVTLDHMVQAEMAYWQAQGATQWFSEVKGAAISILSLHDVEHGTRFLQKYVNTSTGTGNRTGRDAVLCQKCHADNVIGVLAGAVIVFGDDVPAGQATMNGAPYDPTGQWLVVDYSDADNGHEGLIQLGGDHPDGTTLGLGRGRVVAELNPVIAAREYADRLATARTSFILSDPAAGTWKNDRNLPGRALAIAEAPTVVIPPLTEAMHFNHITAPKANFRDASGRDGSCQGCHPAHRFDRSLDGYPITPDGQNAFAGGDNRDAAGGCFVGRDVHSNPRKDVDGVETAEYLTPVGQWLSANVFEDASDQGESGKGIWCTNCHNQLSRVLWQADNLAPGEAFDPDPGHTLRDDTLADLAAELGVTEATIHSMIDPRGDGETPAAKEAGGVVCAEGVDPDTMTSPEDCDFTVAPWAPLATRYGVGLDGNGDGLYATGAPILTGGGADFIALSDFQFVSGKVYDPADPGNTPTGEPILGDADFGDGVTGTRNGIADTELTFVSNPVTGQIALDADGDIIVNVYHHDPNVSADKYDGLAAATGIGPAPIYAASDGGDYWISPGSPKCADCHAPPFVEGQGGVAFPINGEGKYSNMRYTKGHSGLSCQACHQSIHGLYPVFADADGNTVDPTTYDQAAALNPDGSHGPVKCAGCHTGLKQLDGEDVPTILPASITTYEDAVILIHANAGDNGGAATSHFQSFTAEEIADLQGGDGGDGEPDAANGASLYTSNNCTTCHGASGEGVGSFPPVAGLGATELQSACDGSGTMPALCEPLTASDIADLGAYLETLGGGDGADAVNGASLYTSNNCATCHGASGEGVGSFPPVAGLGATELQASCDGSGTMPALCEPLTASDIADLGAYMETL
jgi:cytochrome c553